MKSLAIAGYFSPLDSRTTRASSTTCSHLSRFHYFFTFFYHGKTQLLTFRFPVLSLENYQISTIVPLFHIKCYFTSFFLFHKECHSTIPMQFIQFFNSKLIAKCIDFINKSIYLKYYWLDM